MFGLTFFDFAIILVLYLVFIFVLKGMAISILGMRRFACNGFEPYIPCYQDCILGVIADDINIFGGKYTEWCGHLFGLSVMDLAMFFIALYNRISFLALVFVLVIFLALRQYRLRSCYAIYKDYAPKQAILFIILSIFLGIDYLLLFMIRNNVPVSMTFSKQDEWQFQSNRVVLQGLWEEYHGSDVECTWGEYLMMRNFVPVHSCMVNYNNFLY